MDVLASLLIFLRQSFPPKPTFTVNDIPDLSGKIIIVTGANTGVGFETAKALLAHNARVYVAARNREKTEAAIEQLKNLTGGQAIFLKLDLANLKAVKIAAAEFLRLVSYIKLYRISALIVSHEQQGERITRSVQ